MSNKYFALLNIRLDLPEDVPPMPEDLDEFDVWYEKYIGSRMAKIERIVDGLDIEDEEFDFGD